MEAKNIKDENNEAQNNEDLVESDYVQSNDELAKGKKDDVDPLNE